MPRSTPPPVQTPEDETYVSPTRDPEPLPDEELAQRAMEIFEDDLVDPEAVQAEIDQLPPPDDGDLPPTRGLHAKLAEVVREVTYIQKTGTAPKAMGGYPFVEAGRVAAVIRMALAKRRVTMLPESIQQVGEILETETRNGGTLFIQTIAHRWRLTDADTGESCVIESMGTGGDTGDKFSPKAQTNSMKYALLMGFLLETGEDPEFSDLAGPEQGPGVEIGPSNVEGVRQGGRQSGATAAQLDKVREVAREKELSPMALATFIGATLGGKAPDVSEEDDPSEQSRAVLTFLGGLSFEECGKVVRGLMDITD